MKAKTKAKTREVWQNVYGTNRKTLYQDGDVRMSLIPSGKGISVIELSRRRGSVFVPCVSVRVESQHNASLVEVTEVAR